MPALWELLFHLQAWWPHVYIQTAVHHLRELPVWSSEPDRRQEIWIESWHSAGQHGHCSRVLLKAMTCYTGRGTRAHLQLSICDQPKATQGQLLTQPRPQALSTLPALWPRGSGLCEAGKSWRSCSWNWPPDGLGKRECDGTNDQKYNYERGTRASAYWEPSIAKAVGRTDMYHVI